MSFTAEGVVTILSEEELAQLYELRAQRPVCLFSQDLVESIAVDYDDPPPLDELVCYTPEEYQTALDELVSQAGTG